jgi:hypothetical protein
MALNRNTEGRRSPTPPGGYRIRGKLPNGIATALSMCGATLAIKSYGGRGGISANIKVNSCYPIAMSLRGSDRDGRMGRGLG